MVLKDDTANCTNPRCRKRFDIAGVKSMAFLDDTPPPANPTTRTARGVM